MPMTQELRRLNEHEQKIITDALKAVESTDAGARILLEDDAEFVRGLFWTSRESK